MSFSVFFSVFKMKNFCTRPLLSLLRCLRSPQADRGCVGPRGVPDLVTKTIDERIFYEDSLLAWHSILHLSILPPSRTRCHKYRLSAVNVFYECQAIVRLRRCRNKETLFCSSTYAFRSTQDNNSCNVAYIFLMLVNLANHCS